MVYCTYNVLNMFRVLLCPSSGARDYRCVTTAYGVQFLVAGCRGSGAGQQVRVQEEGCCTYNMLNMFRVLLCPSSGARDYMCVTTAYGVQCLVAGCRGLGAEQQAMCPERGMLHL